MDEVERKQFLDALRSDNDFRAAVRRELLTEELLNLPQTVATLVDVVAERRRDITALATDVRNYMERTITLVGEGFAAVRTEISGSGTHINTGLWELRTDMDTGLAALRDENSELRADMRAGFTAADAKFDQVTAELRVIKDQLAS